MGGLRSPPVRKDNAEAWRQTLILLSTGCRAFPAKRIIINGGGRGRPPVSVSSWAVEGICEGKRKR